MNTQLLIILFVLHPIADYLLQTSWEAYNKKTKFLPLFVHSLVYSFSISLVLYFLKITSVQNLWMIFSILFVTHLLLDNRKVIELYTEKIKRLERGHVEFDFISFLTDQAFHYVVIFFIALIF